MATGEDRSAAENADRSTRSAARLVDRHALLLIVLVGAGVRLATAGGQSFWVDELATLNVVQRPPLDLLEWVTLGESNPAFYYLLAGGWERVFGSSELGLRSLSAVFGIATIPVVYAAARALASRRVGLIAAGLTATNPMLVWYSQEARNYELLVLTSALSFLFFVWALQRDDRRWVWGWALASALALNTHYFAVFLIVPEAAWLLRARRRLREDILLSIGALAVVVLALLPLLGFQRDHPSGISTFNLGDRLVQIPEHFLVGMTVPWQGLPVVVGAAVAVAAVYATLKSIRDRGAVPAGLKVAGGVAALGFGVVLVALAVGSDFLLTRNLLELWAPVVVAVAAVLGAAAVGRVGPLVAAGVCVIGLAVAIWTAATPEAGRPDWAELAAEIGPAPQERVVVSQSNYSAPIAHYLDGTRTPSREEPLASSELVVIEPRKTDDFGLGPCWWMFTCGGTDSVDAQPFEPPNGFELERTGSTELFDFSVYEARKPIEIVRPKEYIPRVFVQSPS